MKKIRSLLVCSILAVYLCPQTLAVTPAPQTEYAREFITKAEGQQWFLDEIERLLNTNQKSIDTLTGPDDLTIITSLGFANQGIEGKVPAAAGELTALRQLYLSGNKLSGNIPAGLFALPVLETVDLSFNSYNGGLPAGLNGMTGLQYLAVADNAWGGGLPDLSAVTGLKTLSAWGCGLTGGISESLYTLTKLQILDLAGNSLAGQISAPIGGLTELQLLSLGGNELTGPIPAELSNLAALTTLDLSSNILEGVVPDGFGAIDKLMEIHLEGNKLRGHLPSSIDARLTAGAVVYARDNYLTGPVLAKVADNARNFCDGAATEQYRVNGPTSLSVNESSKINVWPMVQNRDIKTGDTWLKPLLPIDCYTAKIENDPKAN